MPNHAIQLAVLVSGGGTTLQNLIDVIASGELDAKISMVVGSKPDIGGIKRAVDTNLGHAVVQRKDFVSTKDFSQKIFQLIESSGADLVCLAGWLTLLEIPDKWIGRVMNIHPALLPGFGGKGMYGHNVHQAVLDHGCKVSGCTVHFVDNSYDSGPIILQRTCPVREGDDASSLASRVFDEEKIAYPQAIRLFAEGKLKIEGRRVRISE